MKYTQTYIDTQTYTDTRTPTHTHTRARTQPYDSLYQTKTCKAIQVRIAETEHAEIWWGKREESMAGERGLVRWG